MARHRFQRGSRFLFRFATGGFREDFVKIS